jgi:hypothetical protein
MKGFKTMDPDQIRELIADEPDIITEAVQREEQVYRNAACPVCHERGCEKELEPTVVIPAEDGSPQIVASPFSSDHPLPRGYAVCRTCGTKFDPYSGVIREAAPFMTHEPQTGHH